MFARQFRFHGHNSLRFVYQTGKSAYTQHLKVLWVPEGHTRIAVVVSKKVHKSAVVRNRIRRRLYELVRTYAKAEGVLFGSVIIVVQNDTVASMSADVLREEVAGLLQKIA
jgi:ribonuclease P protein component